MAGLETHAAGWLTRVVFWMVRRKVGQLTGRAHVVEPVRITAHHPRLLMAYGQMEMGQEAAHSVPAATKTLAGVKVASLVGCPY
jgi:hypothetical protein